jgi:electron transport complex protein RnfG
MRIFGLIKSPALILSLFSLLGIGLVTTVYQHTKATIAANERAALLRALEELVPAANFDNDPLNETVTARDPALGDGKPITAFIARKHGEPTAIILPVTAPDGYNGAIQLLIAIRADESLAGVRVINHRETPGLGDLIEVKKSAWIEGFEGRSLLDPPEARWKVKREGGDFDQFTGATITPRAIVKSVKNTLEFFRSHRGKLFQAGPGGPEASRESAR